MRRDRTRPSLSVLIVDPISLLHPSIYQLLVMLNKSVYDGRSVVLVLSPLPPSRAMQSLARAIRERGSPFFDPYFVPSLAQRDYAVVEAGVTTDADVERLLRRAIADHLRRRQPPSSAVITHFR